MSELTVAKITTPSNTTPLILSTGNTTSSFIKINANGEIVIFGTLNMLD